MVRWVARKFNLVVLFIVALMGPMLGVANAAEVALYRDGSFVDLNQEAKNLANTLINNGDTVIDITGTTGAFVGPLATADILVIPELEIGDLNAALDASTRDNIRAFVDTGGIMVVHGGSSGANDKAITLMNAIFGVSFVASGSDCNGTTFSPLTSEAESQGFSGAPSPLTNLSCTTKVTKASIASTGGTTIYEYDADDAVVFSVGKGSGRLFFFGWDWYDAPPQGSADGNWPPLYGFISTNSNAIASGGKRPLTPVPTLPFFGLLALSSLLGLFGMRKLKA